MYIWAYSRVLIHVYTYVSIFDQYLHMFDAYSRISDVDLDIFKHMVMCACFMCACMYVCFCVCVPVCVCVCVCLFVFVRARGVVRALPLGFFFVCVCMQRGVVRALPLCFLCATARGVRPGRYYTIDGAILPLACDCNFICVYRLFRTPQPLRGSEAPPPAGALAKKITVFCLFVWEVCLC